MKDKGYTKLQLIELRLNIYPVYLKYKIYSRYTSGFAMSFNNWLEYHGEFSLIL